MMHSAHFPGIHFCLQRLVFFRSARFGSLPVPPRGHFQGIEPGGNHLVCPTLRDRPLFRLRDIQKFGNRFRAYVVHREEMAANLLKALTASVV